jgi:AbrB family looped-hinge helix DNA binding protein
MNRPKGKYAWTAKVGEKGQIVIPKEARDVFNIRPGDTLLLLGDEAQGIAIIKSDRFLEFTEALLQAQKPTEDKQ